MEQDEKLHLLKMQVGFGGSILEANGTILLACMVLIELIAGYGIL